MWSRIPRTSGSSRAWRTARRTSTVDAEENFEPPLNSGPAMGITATPSVPTW